MNRSQSQGGRIAVTLVLIAAATVVYFFVPVPGRMRDSYWALMFFLGCAVLGALILVTIGRLLRAGADERIRGLILLLTLAVLFFAWTDNSLARIPGEFADLHTKTDALYFTISTLATVGFGDVHAAGQLARAAVTLEIVFNLVFLGASVSMISGIIRRQTHRLGNRGPGDAPPGPAPPPDSGGPR